MIVPHRNAAYGCKILQQYTNTMRTCTDTMRTANDTPRTPQFIQRKARFPLGGIFRAERYFLLSFDAHFPPIGQFKEKKMSLHAENSAWWKMALKDS